KHQTRVARPAGAAKTGFVLDALTAPPAAAFLPFRPAGLIETQEERLTIFAQPGMPVNEGNMVGIRQPGLGDLLERHVRPLALAATVHDAARLLVLAIEDRTVERSQTMLGDPGIHSGASLLAALLAPVGRAQISVQLPIT